MSFKLSVAREIATTDIGICTVARKYEIQSTIKIQAAHKLLGLNDFSLLLLKKADGAVAANELEKKPDGIISHLSNTISERHNLKPKFSI